SLDQSRRLDQLAAPALIDGAQSPAPLAQRLAALALGFSVHEVSQALGFGQIQFAVLEGAAGVFARLGDADAGLTQAGVYDRRDNGLAAMDLQLGDVLAGEAVRAGKPER